jgi:lipoprotein NlpD
VKALLAVPLLALLAGCVAPGAAPIGDLSKAGPVAMPAPPARPPAEPLLPALPGPAPSAGEALVQKGDTLFGIAFQNGLDYRDLAHWNNIPSPYLIQPGQVLRLTPPVEAREAARAAESLPIREVPPLQAKIIREPPLVTEPQAQRLPFSEANWARINGGTVQLARAVERPAAMQGHAAAEPAPSASVEQSAGEGWRWPAEGSLIGRFGESGGKGINISGERQAPVFSAAPGKVVYSGSGLRGYGKMVIVRHAGEFLTAYAHNHAVLVKEGDWVKGGQQIAQMGDSESDRVKLHFEVRQYGKPIDPLKILPERK